MVKEIYKDVGGFEDLYQISNLGNVKSLYKNIVMKPQQISSGYYSVRLTKNKRAKNFYIHRLVAKAFISNPESKPHINHKNGLKNSNSSENLEWCTRSENDKHAFKNGLKEATRIAARETISKWNKSKKHSLNLKRRWKDGAMSHLVFKGEKNHKAKLKESQVRNIINMFSKKNTSIAELSRTYKVSWSTIKLITSGKNWSYLSQNL